MDQFGFDARLEASPLINELVSTLTEVRRTLDEVNRKVDSLLVQSNANHSPQFDNPSVPGVTLGVPKPSVDLAPHQSSSNAIASNQNMAHNDWDLDVGEASNLVNSSLISDMAPESEDALWQRGSSDFGRFNSLEIFNGFGSQQAGHGLAALPSTLSDLHTLPSGKMLASPTCPDGVWSDLPPPLSRVQAVPLPPVTSSYETWDHREGSDVNYGGECEDFPGGEPHNHQFTQRWTNGLAEEAESSTSLAIAKPKHRENETQSESSTPAASSFEGSYDRHRSAEEKRQRFTLICKALGVSWRGDEISSLCIIIQRLGGTVPPVVGDPTGHLTRSQKQTRKRRARRACFEELKRLVGPWTDVRLYERKVLDNVLARVTARNGDEAPGYGPYYMFHLS